MTMRHKAILTPVLCVCFLVCSLQNSHAGTPMSDRIAVEAGVKAELSKDLALPYAPDATLSGRICLDGRPTKEFQGDLVEYWVNLECPYCGIEEPLRAQRENPGMCIVVRHSPSDNYGESLKKALSFEALLRFSPNAAHSFWNAVVPRTPLGVPKPYEAALQTALQDAAIVPEDFADSLQQVAPVVGADIIASQSRITSTPTWILDGIRFPACDFTASQVPLALELAHKARADDADAKERIVQMITRGLLNESVL